MNQSNMNIRERRSEDPAQSNKTLDDPNHLVQVQDGAMHMYRDAPAGSQQPFGYMSTKEEYSEYDLRLEFRWGVKRFAPRADSPRDAGLLYHVVGIDRVWPQSVECQIWEHDVGDTYAVYTRVTAPVDPARIEHPVYLAAEVGSVPHVVGSSTEIGRVGRNPKSEQEGWNTIEVRVRGDRATHIINGVTNNVVLKMERWLDNAWVPLRKGRIALQLEGAEVLYRNIQIREVKSAAGGAASKASRAHSPDGAGISAQSNVAGAQRVDLVRMPMNSLPEPVYAKSARPRRHQAFASTPARRPPSSIRPGIPGWLTRGSMAAIPTNVGAPRSRTHAIPSSTGPNMSG